MPAGSTKLTICTSGVILTLFTAAACLFRGEKIDFNTQVKPIINRKCISCHGGVRAKGGFSLLFQEEAFAKTASGKPAIVPGDPGQSEMIRRLTLDDPEERMPYKHEPLSKDEIAILRKWVAQGAPWGQHWAYVPVAKPEPPELKDPWIRNDIDRYVLARLKEEKLEPAAEASPAVLLRRVSLDLTGLYPSDALAQRYLQSKDPDAYEQLVDTLLASPHFGEKWTAMWLDLARYADTKGYERDDSRNIWRYRDWLIRAFNADMPYDRFLTEQLAGDLLPDPSDADYIATAFHRNTMTNDEGGTDNEEFRTAAVLDRVNTTWEALLGTTFACTQCHSHPYDPFHHEDYYRFMAYFNDTRDEDTQADYPLLRQFNDTDQVRLDSLTSWVGRVAGAREANNVRRLVRTWQPAINGLTADHFINGELDDTKWLVFRRNGSARLKAVDLDPGRNLLIFRWRTVTPGGSWQLHLDSAGGRIMSTVSVVTANDWKIASVDLPNVQGVHDLYITYSNPAIKNPSQNGLEFDWFCFTDQFPGQDNPGYAGEHAVFWDLLTKPAPTTPVMMDNPADMHRVSNVFERGNWLVKGQVVTPGVPASLSDCMPKQAPANRLGLAMWMTSKKNPLVSRTMVNRVWEQLFGTGIVETLEDLGTQGSPPTHRALLDDLAWNYMNTDGWSLKRLLKTIVMSATYREDSRVTPASLAADPYDHLFSRGTRVRLSAEQLRDQDLCICGRLSPELYGPSVFPYQPGGIWMSPWNGASWVASKGGEQYRRAMYTYWKRTASYPAMISFDATSREVCTARRIRTNTPLQALVTLNDSVYLDMARHFAQLMDSLRPHDPAGQIAEGYRCMLYDSISPKKLLVLLGLYQEALQKFTAAPAKADEMLGFEAAVSARQPGGAIGNHPRQAALVVVANAMLNVDEVITKN
jgi:Protein of unknown function (DUF1549)/Protein of unknown function (DUF1553)/Planctomycete cytochrome C